MNQSKKAFISLSVICNLLTSSHDSLATWLKLAYITLHVTADDEDIFILKFSFLSSFGSPKLLFQSSLNQHVYCAASLIIALINCSQSELSTALSIAYKSIMCSQLYISNTELPLVFTCQQRAISCNKFMHRLFPMVISCSCAYQTLSDLYGEKYGLFRSVQYENLLNILAVTFYIAICYL